MKNFLTLALITTLSAGCASHNLPKDAYMKGVESNISTPWGSHKLVITEAATGTAAKNLTTETPPTIKK